MKRCVCNKRIRKNAILSLTHTFYITNTYFIYPEYEVHKSFVITRLVRNCNYLGLRHERLNRLGLDRLRLLLLDILLAKLAGLLALVNGRRLRSGLVGLLAGRFTLFLLLAILGDEAVLEALLGRAVDGDEEDGGDAEEEEEKENSESDQIHFINFSGFG